MKRFTFLLCLIIFSLNSVKGQIPTEGLIGFWPFNGNANDLSINNNHGTVNGATLVSDRFGLTNRAYRFDGNDYISIPHSATLDMQSSLSFSVWEKPETTSGTRMIFGKSNYTTKTNYLLRVKPNGYIQWEYNGYTDTDSVPLQLNVWHHIVVTASSPGQVKRVYIDNRLIKETSSSSGPFGLITNPFTIGYASYNSEYFLGAIDDIRMYNKELSVSEINALFNESCNTTYSLTETACKSYTLNSQTYTASGTYTQTLTNTIGCDSIITLNLTINNVDATVSVVGNTLTANQSGATYQWLDCDNNFAPLSEETNQSFTATSNGNYAVKVSLNECADTSICYAISPVSIVKNNFEDDISFHSNFTYDKLTINLGKIHENITAIVTNPSLC